MKRTHSALTNDLIPFLRHPDTYKKSFPKKQLSLPPRNPLSTSLGISHQTARAVGTKILCGSNIYDVTDCHQRLEWVAVTSNRWWRQPRVVTSRVWPAPEWISPSARLVVSVVEGLGGWTNVSAGAVSPSGSRRGAPSSSEFFQTTDRGLNEPKGDEPRPLDRIHSVAYPFHPLWLYIYRFLFCVCAGCAYSRGVIELRRSKSK